MYDTGCADSAAVATTATTRWLRMDLLRRRLRRMLSLFHLLFLVLSPFVSPTALVAAPTRSLVLPDAVGRTAAVRRLNTLIRHVIVGGHHVVVSTDEALHHVTTAAAVWTRTTVPVDAARHTLSLVAGTLVVWLHIPGDNEMVMIHDRI